MPCQPISLLLKLRNDFRALQNPFVGNEPLGRQNHEFGLFCGFCGFCGSGSGVWAGDGGAVGFGVGAMVGAGVSVGAAVGSGVGSGVGTAVGSGVGGT